MKKVFLLDKLRAIDMQPVMFGIDATVKSLGETSNFFGYNLSAWVTKYKTNTACLCNLALIFIP